MTDMTRFHGVIPAMVTPFTRDFRLDEPRLKALIEDYIAAGVHGLSVAGSQGEFFFLSHDEHIRLIEVTVETVNGRVPVYAGTGAAATHTSVELTRAAERIGADMAMVITPYFVQPNDEELYTHFRTVAEATKLPVLLYNNPPRTQVNVSLPLFRRCAEIANVAGIKDSSGDVTQFAEYVRQTGKLGFAGRDTIALAVLLHGGAGAISPAANVFPQAMVALYDHARAGRWDEARRMHDLLAPLRIAWGLGSFPVVIKEAMGLVGRDAGPTRLPIVGLEGDKRAQLSRIVETIAAAVG